MLEDLLQRHPQMESFVAKRRGWLWMCTEKELRAWFESAGFNTPFASLGVRAEQIRGHRSRIARMQQHLAGLDAELRAQIR
eukprot:2738326-Pleurochrysis_carterae.AAC.1